MFYLWEEIPHSPETISTPSLSFSGDDVYQQYTLPFSFPFYGTGYNSMGISTNGFVDFIHQSADYDIDIRVGNSIISIWDVDLSSASFGSVDVENKTDRVVIQWKTETYDDAGDSTNEENIFQIVLCQNGEIYFHFLKFGCSNCSYEYKFSGKGDIWNQTGIAAGDGDMYLLLSRELQAMPPEIGAQRSFRIAPGPADLDIGAVVSGAGEFNRDGILKGEGPAGREAPGILKGSSPGTAYIDAILDGTDLVERGFLLPGRNLLEVDALLRAEHDDILTGRRLYLSDPLNLRTSAVYRSPQEIFTLQWLYGDFSMTQVPCRAIDDTGTRYHVADHPCLEVSKVYVDGAEVTAGFSIYLSRDDATGRRITLVEFSEPQYLRQVAVSCKGKPDWRGLLIESPADIIRDVFLEMQGYSPDVIDEQALSEFYAESIRRNIQLSVRISEPLTVRAFLDEIARNINALWLISDGRSIMRYVSW